MTYCKCAIIVLYMAIIVYYKRFTIILTFSILSNHLSHFLLGAINMYFTSTNIQMKFLIFKYYHSDFISYFCY